MSFAALINLLPMTREEDFNTNLLKKHSVSLAKQENILQKLSYMGSFEELSRWVEVNSESKKFIANPLNAGDADREVCLTEIQKPLFLALKNIENRRINGRDKRLIEAAEVGDLPVIADIIASAAWTYWQNHNFQISPDVRINISAVCQFQNDERNQQKKDFKKAQIDHIGAVLDFVKARKKGAFQECLDFIETEIINKNDDFED